MPNFYNTVTSSYAKFAHNALLKELYVPKASFCGIIVDPLLRDPYPKMTATVKEKSIIVMNFVWRY